MDIFLKKMEIQNFKGIKKLDIEFSKKTVIRGDNETGKSSLADALVWALFNKDARGNAPGTDGFNPKPYSKDGKEIHYLDTSVALTLTVDGAPLELTKLQSENWVKSRGQLEAEFAGNTTTYYINELPVKKKDYDAKIASFADEALFRMITTLGAFNALEWKKRRAFLLTLTDSDVDKKLIQKPDYVQIKNALADGQSVEDLKAILASKIKKLKEELTTLPARIDEANNLMPSINPTLAAGARASIATLEKELENLNAKIAQSNSESEIAQHNKLIEQAEFEIRIQKEKEIRTLEAKKEQKRTEIQNLEHDVYSNQRYAAQQDGIARSCGEEIEKIEARLTELREEFKRIKAETLEVQVDETCPACGQALPPEKVERAIEAATAKLNEKKKAHLAEINAEGVRGKGRLEKLMQEKETAEAEAEKARKMNENAAKELEERKKELVLIVIDTSESERMKRKLAGLEQHRSELQTNEGVSEARKRLEAEKENLKNAIQQANELILKAAQKEEITARVKELEEKQQRYGFELVDLEKLNFLCDEYISERCGKLEADINRHFPSVRWKLFDTQINGAINPCCVCMVPSQNGALVPYPAANTAGRINADLQIITVLNKKYNITAPLFIDNAESVTKLCETAAQNIILVVSSEKELTVTNI